eukprot:gene114-28_t
MTAADAVKNPAEAPEVDEAKKTREMSEEHKNNPVVQKLCALDEKYMDLEKEYQKKWAELQKDYEEKQAPFLKDRTKVLLEAEKEAKKDAEEETATPGIPGFWLQVLKAHLAFSEDVQEWDEPVLQNLKDIRSENLPDADGLNQAGFKLIFEFQENEYFTNTTLERVFHTSQDSPYMTELNCTKIVMEDAIEWKAGKDVTIEMKKPKGGGAKKKKAPKKEPRDSFFRKFFRTIDTEEGDPEELEDLIGKVFEEMGFDPKESEAEEELDEAYEQAIERVMDEAYEQGLQLRDSLIPFAIRFFTGEALPIDDEEDEEDADDDDEDDDDDDDDDDEDDSDDSEVEAKPVKKDLFKAVTKGLFEVQ